MAIYYKCSNGERVTQATIDRRLSEAYRKRYEDGHAVCEETGKCAEGSSHIISQKRCKQLHLTDLIWNPENFFPATNEINRQWENNNTELKNYEKYMKVVEKYDPEGYRKRRNL